MTEKGNRRRIRKALAAAGKPVPKPGAFRVKISGKPVLRADELPGLSSLRRRKVEVVYID